MTLRKVRCIEGHDADDLYHFLHDAAFAGSCERRGSLWIAKAEKPSNGVYSRTFGSLERAEEWLRKQAFHESFDGLA